MSEGIIMISMLSALLWLIGLALAACNTVEGVGKDVQAGGQAIEKAATKNRAIDAPCSRFAR